jgi:hypothetical protein
MVDLSIVIVSFNTKALLRDCIASVYRETTIKVIEIIVVDNASADGSVDMLRSEFPKVKIIPNTQNKGFAAANNQGMAASHGRYLLLLNSDTIILNGAIDKMFEFMESRNDVSIAGCRQVYPTMQLQPSCRSFPTLWNIFTEATFLYKFFPRTKIFGQYYLSYFQYDTVKEIDVVMGSFMFIRKNVIDDIGGFDEDFFFFTEETDFCYRARAKGHRSYFFPGAEIIHIGGGSQKNLYWTFKQLHLSQYYFINKHYHGIENICMRILKRFGILIRIPVYFIQSFLFRDRIAMEKARVHVKLVLCNFNAPGSDQETRE